MITYNIKTVLVPIDFSDTSGIALDHAVFMAKLNKANLILLHVIETFSFTSAIGHSMKGTNFEAQAEEMVKKKLVEFKKRILEKDGINVKTDVKVGRIHKEILQKSEEIAADLIVMGTHGVSGFQEYLLGSNTTRVMSASKCPVLSVQQHSDKNGYKNVVVPIDDSRHSREKISYAIGLCEQYNAKLHLVAFDMDGSEESQKRFKLQINQLEEIFKKHEILYDTKLDTTDDSVESILDYCKSVNADLIIIMTEQEFDLKGVIFGPAAQRIVNHSKIPVISIRPHFNPDTIEFHGYGW